MAAKGSAAKADIVAKLLQTFEGSFTPDEKEVRVDVLENGVPVQLKIAITAVKVPIANSPKINITQDFPEFSISEEEREKMQSALNELGVKF